MATAASFYVSSTTHNSATIRVELGDGYSKFRIFCRTAGGATAKDTTLTRTADFNYTISGLSSSTDYAVNVCSIPASGQGGEWAVAEDFTTDSAPAPTRPCFFSWLRGLVSSPPSINELSRGGNLPPYLNAAGWDSYTANINDVREYLGLSRYGFTTAIGGETKLSAAIVNQAINAIKNMSPPISPPGLTTSMITPLSAVLLNKLADSLNSVT